MADIFYVYEHWRPDKDICFWVGKGHGRRAYKFKRNPHYNRIVKKLAKLGMCVEVRLVTSALSERDALNLEVQRIAFWRSANVVLANLTDGGEGCVGMKQSKKSRALLRAARLKQIFTPDDVARHRDAMASPDVRSKLSQAKKAAFAAGKPNSFAGRRHSNKTKKHWSKIRTGRKLSDKHRANISVGLKSFAKRKTTTEPAK